MKAFLITMDALVGLAFMFLILTLMMSATYQPTASKSAYLKVVSFDVLNAMEKTGRLGDLLDTGSGCAQEIIEGTPEIICIQVAITDSSGNAAALVAKSGCSSGSTQLQTVKTLFFHGNKIYVLDAKSWYKRAST